MPFCISCGQENPDVAKFCLACGSPMARAAAPAPAEVRVEERRLVTAVFIDIVGSTASAEQLDPEDVRALLAPYYVEARRELERHGGSVAKFIGDAVVALFGAPIAHEDDPERAVRAALAVHEGDRGAERERRLARAQDPHGHQHGRGDRRARRRTPARAIGEAAGDVMNTAARIQGGAPINGILVGELTYERTKHAIEYREAEPVVAKGKAEPVRDLGGPGGARAAVAPRRAGGGRSSGASDELAKVLGLWENGGCRADARARDGRRHARDRQEPPARGGRGRLTAAVGTHALGPLPARTARGSRTGP